MKKRIGRRLVSLLLTVVTVLTMLPAMTLPALAATSGKVIGLTDTSIDLNFTGDAENAWTARDDRIIGHVKTERKGWSNNRHQSTLTIKNNKKTTATLSFGYTIDKNNGEIKVGNNAASASDTVTQELKPNEGISIYIYSSSEKDAEVQITITALKLVADVTATVTFQPAENGSYTVDEQKITKEYTNTQRSTAAYQVVATPAKGYQFRDWYNVTTGKPLSKKSSDALNVEEDCEITARFVPANAATFLVGSETFIALDEATEYAKANTINMITLIKDGTLLQGDYIIPSGITLLIPFDDMETLYTSKPGYVNTAETPTAYKTLTMASGSSITVNGAISVGGKHYAGSSGSCCKATGSYGQIIMQEGSSITLSKGANLYAWGYITGDGEITAAPGATVYEYFQVADWRGGLAVSKLIGNKKEVFPFSQYYVQNIEAALTIQAGAQEYAYFSVDAAVVKTKSVTIDFIGSNESLFRIHDGGELTKKYDPKTDRITYTTKGSASLDSLALSVADYNINSKDYVLPVNNNMTLEILSGRVAVNCDAALLPGAQITIARGAELSVSTDKSLYVYDRDQWKGPYVYGSKESGFKPIPYSPSKPGTRTLADAKIDVNGTLTAAGSVYTTDNGADICSSEGGGRFVQQGTPGTATVTHQVSNQENGKTFGIPYCKITYGDIHITPAQLKNADGKYTETKDAVANDTFTYCKCQDCGDGTWVKDVAAINDSTGKQVTTRNTLQKAVTDVKDNQYIKLLHNTTEKTINVNNRSLYLDLNGRTVTGDISVTSGYKLYGMDNSSKEYIAPSGKIVGTVTGTVAPTYQTPPTVDGEYDRYVAIQGAEENGTLNLSFHHFNISVTGYRFELAAPQCALFFIGKFQGDKAAKDYLTSLGFTLKGEDGRPLGEDNYELPADKDIPPEAEPGDSPVVRSGDAFLFEVYLKRSFEKDKPAAYTEKIIATAQAMFKNNETQDSEPKKWSFKDAWTETDGLKDLTPKQQEILKKFLDELGIKQ